jgi:hypothetical protein
MSSKLGETGKTDSTYKFFLGKYIGRDERAVTEL